MQVLTVVTAGGGDDLVGSTSEENALIGWKALKACDSKSALLKMRRSVNSVVTYSP